MRGSSATRQQSGLPGTMGDMTDAPLGRSAVYTILTTGYVGSTGPGVAATVSYVTEATGM